MIPQLVAPALDWYTGRRRHQLEAVWRRPGEVQEVALRSLLWAAADTEFGLEHGFRSIRTVAQYQERVPIREYADFKPMWARAVAGARGVTWPGHCGDWVNTSGTTSGDKMIPVTRRPSLLIARAAGMPCSSPARGWEGGISWTAR